MLWKAAEQGRRFVETARDAEGIYHIDEWPRVRTSPRLPDVAVGAVVAPLRVAQRCTLGFLDPVQDGLYLLAGLRELGVPTSFHLGRETVPATPNAGVFAWVCHRGRVLSTSLPVLETYTEVLRVEASGTTERSERAQHR